MKTFLKVLSFGLCVLVLQCCNQGPKYGTISFYSSNNTAVATALSSKAYSKPSVLTPGMSSRNTVEAYLYLKKIEISTNGQDWVEVIGSTGSLAVDVVRNQTIRISAGAFVPEGQYHGLRISLEPRVTFKEVASDGTFAVISTVNVTLAQLPSMLGVGDAVGQENLTSLDNITLSSANGLLVPFDIEANTETYLILDLEARWGGAPDNITDWWLFLDARATRFIG